MWGKTEISVPRHELGERAGTAAARCRRGVARGVVLGAVLGLGGAWWPLPARAQAMPLEPGLQVVLLKKIFTYDKGVVDRGTKVLVLSSPATNATTSAVVAAFAAINVPVAKVTAAELAAQIGGAAVLYVLAPDYNNKVAAMCVERQVLTVSGHPALAEGGQVSLALGKSGGKPEIIVHAARAKAESHLFPTPVLKLARVVM
jgi:hypothetical protein